MAGLLQSVDSLNTLVLAGGRGGGKSILLQWCIGFYALTCGDGFNGVLIRHDLAGLAKLEDLLLQQMPMLLPNSKYLKAKRTWRLSNGGVLRLPGSHYIDPTGSSRGVVQIINATDVRYSIEEFEALLQPTAESTYSGPAPIWQGQRESTLQEIAEALSFIPRRVAGSNSYSEYRNLLWGLISAVVEAGYSRSVAIEMMEVHSPSHQCGWNIQQVADSGGEQIHAGTFFHYAKTHGWRRHG